MKKSFSKVVYLIGTILTFTLLLSACGSNNKESSKSNKINVVTSVNFYSEAAKAVLGDKGNVTSIINSPSSNPHDFQPTPKDSKTVAKADFVIYNGAHYDSWMQSLLNNNSSAKVTNVSNDLMGKDDHDNAHIWYDYRTMPKLVNSLAKQFSKKDAKNAKFYENNAKKYIESLKPIEKTVKQIKQQHKHNNKVDVTEPVFNYMLNDMGYTINDAGFSKAVEHEIDPTPQNIRDLQDDIKHKKISFLVVNSQTSDTTVQNMIKLANENKLPIVKVSETMPKNTNYKDWIMSSLNQVKNLNK
ncbi:zinc ABC transporter substrate-binding protein [Apilactobacillus sp. TMW 2.2459]|uniref:metal ABC transporter solute-binding protein, Zn/Mn family n=1 Tax=Apilactobacillus xinyiensis TaxID=2841032 RepID=UPI00200D1C06|nr:zinc ABC transporter substrate-binding protein [Apilactobacillus xinyiensis]MCL0312555.1 zinc ABC transporter substrate-binding protein [Apilactobacillus xinyiensis]